MIIKISKRSTGSSFTKLANYICRDRPGKEDRIQSITTAGFSIEQPDWEVACRQVSEQHREKTKNARSKQDNTLHLIISFRPRECENLNVSDLEAIAQRVCESIQLGGHKRIAAVHGDTQDPHMHLAVSLLDDQGRRRTPYKAFVALRAVREEIEKQYGFEPPGERAAGRSADRAAKLSDPNRKRESHSNQASFEGWLKTNIATGLAAEIQREGATWQSVQDFLSAHGAALRKQGAGLVFASTREKIFVKASTVDRGFSLGKLKAALGEWKAVESNVVPTGGFKTEFLQSKELFAEYRMEADQRKIERTAERAAAQKDFQTAKNAVAAEIRTKKEEVMKTEADPGLRVSKLKALTFERSQLIEAIREQNEKRSAAISESFRHKTWLQFLQEKSQTGDLSAIRALQSRNDSTTVHPGNQVFSTSSWEPVGNTLRGLKAEIRSNGDLAYRLPSNRKKEEIIDKGRRLLVGDKLSNEMLDASLKLAVSKFGSTLHLQGSEEFKKAIMRRAEQTNLKLTFADREKRTATRTNVGMKPAVAGSLLAAKQNRPRAAKLADKAQMEAAIAREGIKNDAKRQLPTNAKEQTAGRETPPKKPRRSENER